MEIMRNCKIQGIFWKWVCKNILLDWTLGVRGKQEWEMCPSWSESKLLVPFTEMGSMEVREGVCTVRSLSGGAEWAIGYIREEVRVRNTSLTQACS